MLPETVSAPVLAFDTSAAHCAAALLLVDGSCLVRHEAMATGQAERLMPMLCALMDDAGLAWRDLGRIGVGIGPGNFTGIRISVAAARGLALGLGVPAIGVSRMEALAHGLPRPLLVAEDARRSEVWVQAFGPDGDGDLGLIGAVELPAAFPGMPVTGSAAHLAARPALDQPRALACAIAEIAAVRTPVGRPVPIYLRPADAAPPSDPPPVILP